MSEEVQETDTAEVSAPSNESPATSLDDVDDPKILKKLIKELRTENAGARRKNSEVASQLEEYNKWKESQQSALERAESDREKLKKENKKLVRDNLVAKHKVPEDLIDFVDGETPDEMEEKAKKLGAKNVGGGLDPSGGNAALFGGDRGAPVGKREDGTSVSDGSGGAFLKALWDKNGRVN